MSLALRYGACGSFFLAAVLLGASLFLPVESIRSVPSRPAQADATVWAIEGGLPANGTTTKGGTWYAPQYSGADGALMLQIAGPLLIAGLLVLLVCGFLVLSGRGVATGWTGTAGLMLAGLGALLFLLGLPMFAKSVTSPPNTVLDNGITPDVGFWSMFIGLLIGSGAALASFSVRPTPTGRIGPDGEPLPPLPILSVENPDAFNPMANRDPRLFRQEEQPYKSFEVTGGRKTFKKAEEGEEGEPDEGPEGSGKEEGGAKKPPAPPPAPAAKASAAKGAAAAQQAKGPPTQPPKGPAKPEAGKPPAQKQA